MDFRDIFYLDGIRYEIFKIKEMYHPNLIMNLSRKAYDIYLMRMNISDELLKKLDEGKMSREVIKEYINEKIEETRRLLEQSKMEKVIPKINLLKSEDHFEKEVDKEKIALLQATLDQWKKFLKLSH